MISIVGNDKLAVTIENFIKAKRIPHAILIEGGIEVNESLLTGESDAITKKAGDILYAGSFVVSGNCKARVERVGKDNYIEKLISDIGKNENVRVVTSDNLIQLSAVRYGVLRVSAREFEREVKSVDKVIDELLYKINKPRPQRIGELVELIKSINSEEN